MNQEKSGNHKELAEDVSERTLADELCREEKLNELTLLKESLEEQKQKAEEYYNRLLRLRAEFDNYRKRIEREKQELIAYGQELIMLKLLPLVDNIERALKAAHEHHDHKMLLDGLVLMEKEFKQFFRTEEIYSIPTHKVKLDPTLHHAISQEEHTDYEDEEIMEEIQKGYTFKGKVIRPALVKVARKVEKNDKKDEGKECTDKPE